MKGNAKVIAALNGLLMDELTAVHKYFLHAEMCKRWGYNKLVEVIGNRVCKEQEHAHELMTHILFLDGKPYIAQINTVDIGSDVKSILANDLKLELEARSKYNDAIMVACDSNDHGSAGVMRHNLEEEEDHITYIQAALDQIEQMGLNNFLASLV